MTTYIVRRSARKDGARISHRDREIYVNNQTVSSEHCSIVDFGDGRYELRDKCSTNGTYIRERNTWVRISAAELAGHDEIRLGTFETTIAELLRGGSGSSGRYRTRLERDPESGAVIEKKWR
jgi:predicted component of type VI protein secretion system